MYLDDHRTALYRFFDADGALLYVGITYDVEQRWADHERTKVWWPNVARKTIQWHDTRPLALKAELAAIREEAPVHNVTGLPWAATHRELTAEERTITQVRGNLTEVCQMAQYAGQPTFVVDTSRERKRVAVIIPFDLYERACAALGERRTPAEDA